MPTMKQIPFALKSNQKRSERSSLERLVNYYPQLQLSGSVSNTALVTTPGSKIAFDIPNDGTPVYGLEQMDGELFCITGKAMYLLKKTSAIKIGDVKLSARVSIANNGYQIVFVSYPKAYIYTKDEGLSELILPKRADSVAYQDGYFIFNARASGQFYVSELLNGSVVNPYDFATAEGAPDDLMHIMSDHRELWLFGSTTTEIWYTTGEDFPFTRMSGAFIEKGILAPFTAAKADNTVFWVGHDSQVYIANGYAPQRISTNAVEFDIERAEMKDAFAFTYAQEGHIFYWLTMPSIQKTWVYDASTALWHERSTRGMGRHLANCHEFVGSVNYIGDYRTSKVYTLDLDYQLDDTDYIDREAISPVYHDNRNWLGCSLFELDVDMVQMPDAVAKSICGANNVKDLKQEPLLSLSWTDNHGKSWSNSYQQVMRYSYESDRRLRWYSLGRFFQRSFRIKTSVPLAHVIVAAYASFRR